MEYSEEESYVKHTIDLEEYLNNIVEKSTSYSDYLTRLIEKEYDEVFERVYDILPNFCQSYLGVDEIKKKEHFPETLKQIFGKIRKIILDYKIPKLSEILKVMNDRVEIIIDELNKISKDFSEVRGKFGKDQGVTEENKGFKNASEKSKKVCSRMVIDLLKVIHNAMLVADIEKD
ncbi:hypothetical protein C1645_744894 [Glomus cerebriforme]|uniref:Uncharacterized protein n=1 Tax=Glomus cerebriforme TaxID=658196 RepID=A0A397S3C4_9GLOM|nr:hypothetical protein C1645_744894 [Glomus cerebriforme]